MATMNPIWGFSSHLYPRHLEVSTSAFFSRHLEVSTSVWLAGGERDCISLSLGLREFLKPSLGVLGLVS